MTKFPVDVPIRKVVKVFEHLGFRVVREGNHIAMVRENAGWESDAIDNAESSTGEGFDIAYDTDTGGDIKG